MTLQFLSREILLVASEDERSRLLVGQLEAIGFMVTMNSEPNTIKDLLEHKFFAVAVFELDTPAVDFALNMLDFIAKVSPQTHGFVLATRESFHAAVSSYRKGAKDVILYEMENFPYLVDCVVKSATRIAQDQDRDRLLNEMNTVHKQFFKMMLNMHIRLMETETHLRYKEGVGMQELPPLNILIVDSEPTLAAGIMDHLSGEEGWSFTHCTWGSEALDHVASANFQVALVGKHLPDLPGSMISSTIQSTSPSTTILMFDYRGAAEISLYECSTSQEIPLLGSEPAAVAEKLKDIRASIASKSQKEEHIKSFKAQNYDFLQKYSRLKNKYAKLMEKSADNEP